MSRSVKGMGRSSILRSNPAFVVLAFALMLGGFQHGSAQLLGHERLDQRDAKVRLACFRVNDLNLLRMKQCFNETFARFLSTDGFYWSLS